MTPIDSYTKLLLHFNGADASTTFTDSEITPKTVNRKGTTQIDTAQYKFGGASCLFDGDSDMLYVGDSLDWSMSTGDFTLDTWVRWSVVPTNNGAYHTFFDQNQTDNTRWGWYIYQASSTFTVRFVCTVAADARIDFTAATGALVADKWYHFACVRNGTQIDHYLNGVSLGNTTNASDIPDFYNASFPADLYIGAAANEYKNTYTQYFNGWLDEFRISKGIARWTGTFNPPTIEYGGTDFAGML